MRINFRYGAAIGILAAAFGMLGPMTAQAGHAPGTSVRVPTGTSAISVQAPATRLLAITGKSVVLSSALERPAWQRDTGIAQREDNRGGNSQERLGLPGQNDRMLVQSYRCRYGYDHGRCCGYGYNRCCYGGGYNRCCYGGGYGGGYNRCCGYGYNRCCYGGGYGGGYNRCCGYGYNHGRCVSHYRR
jgi:hypothetical protein